MAEHDKILLLLIEMRDYEKLLFEWNGGRT
jgi:hypothetical protein